MADVDWISKCNEHRLPEEDKLQMLQIRLEGRDKVESRVSLTAYVIVCYCLPTVGVFSKSLSCVCFCGFNLVFR